MFYPILGAVALASGTIIEKFVLKAKKLNIKLYQILSFLSIVIVMLPFAYFFWNISPEALQLKNILIFLAIIILSIIANLLVFYSLKWEKVSNLEPARILEPLFVILIALIFSFFLTNDAYSRNLKVLIPAIIAALALIFSHIKKHHLVFNKYFVAAIFGSFFFALELALAPLILDYYSPLTFYLIRCLGVLLISLILFSSDLKILDKKTNFLIFITAIIWVLYRIIIYYGYMNYGIDFTTLIIMLSPVLIYFFANIFLKEKLSWRNIIASIIIIACIVYATMR